MRLQYDGTVETWRAVYDSTDFIGEQTRRRRDAVTNAVQRLLDGRRGRVLDAGCGTGEVTRGLAALGHHVTALDASIGMLREARRLAPSGQPGPGGAAYVRGSVCSLPIRSRSFDAVVCVGVMGHLMRRKADRAVADTAVFALRELARVLRPGGFLVVTAPNLSRLHWLLDPPLLRRGLRHRAHIRSLEEAPGSFDGSVRKERRLVSREGTRRWTPLEWSRFVAAEGFRIVDAHGIGFGPFTVLGRGLMSRRRAARLSAWLERGAQTLRPLGWLAAQWITTLTLAPTAGERRSSE